MRYIVTGATGYIGRHLLARLASTHECLPVVRLIRSSESKLPSGITRPAEFHELSEKLVIERGFEGSCVVHLIGPSNDEDDVWLTVLESTRFALRIARGVNAHRFIYVSGFGVSKTHSNAYFRAKALAEDEIRSSGIPHTILRPSYILGDHDELTPFIVSRLKQGIIEIPGDGSYRIQPLHIIDFIEVLANASCQDSSQTLDVLGSSISYYELVSFLAIELFPEAKLVKTGVENYLQRANSDPTADFDQNELAILLANVVGTPTRECLGVRLRCIDEILTMLVREYKMAAAQQ